jgi:PAS domain S-box-containing protein
MKKGSRVGAATLMMFDTVFTRQNHVNPWYFVLLSVTLSVLLTTFINIIQSFLWLGGLSSQLLGIGTIDALLVPLIVAPIVISFINYTADLNVLNRQLEREILERKQAETALAQSEGRYRALINAIGESSFLMTADGNVLVANVTVASRLGRSVEELTGNCIYNYIPTDVARLRREKAREVISTGNPTRFEDERWGRHIDNNVYPLSDDQGNVEKLAILGIDITERKLAEAEREQLILDHLDALSKIKTLSGLLPICASCKKIRDDEGYWSQLEAYLSEHTDAIFSHGICPECAQKFYSDLNKVKDDKEKRRKSEE